MPPSPQQLEDFRERGFFHLGRVFDDAALAEIREEYDRVVDRSPLQIGERDKTPFRFSPLLHVQSEVLKRYATAPVLVETAAALLGDDVRLYWDQAVHKPAGALSDVPWHQDNGYTPVVPHEYVTFTLALDATTEANGCLWIQPGSHREGVKPHAPSDVVFFRGDAGDEAGVAVPQPAGDVLVFSSLTMHRTGGNHSTGPRRSWVIQMCHADARLEESGEALDDRLRLSLHGRPLAEPVRERPLDLKALARGYRSRARA